MANAPDSPETDVSKTTQEASALNLQRVLGLDVVLNVNIGTVRMNLKSLMDLVPGAIIEVEKRIEEPLSLFVDNKKEVARGEVVTIGENLGLRLVEMLPS